ncbi:MAG TPA: acyltransferase [Tissierellaceae bacterium]
MAFYTLDELNNIGFKSLGNNVLISDKTSIYKPELITIGNNCRIDDFCIIASNITFGNNIHIAAYSQITAGTSEIILDDFCGIAYGCRLFAESDDYSGKFMTNPMVPDNYRGVTSKRIWLQKHSIVGTNSVVMPGVVLSEGTAVGAYSLITKSTEPWSIYAGRPARKIKNRKRDLLVLEQEYLSSLDSEK